MEYFANKITKDGLQREIDAITLIRNRGDYKLADSYVYRLQEQVLKCIAYSEDLNLKEARELARIILDYTF